MRWEKKNIIRIYGVETNMFQNVTIQSMEMWIWSLSTMAMGNWWNMENPYGGLSWTMIHKWVRPLRCLIPGGYWPCDARANFPVPQWSSGESKPDQYLGEDRKSLQMYLHPQKKTCYPRNISGMFTHKNVGFTKKYDTIEVLTHPHPGCNCQAERYTLQVGAKVYTYVYMYTCL